MKSVRLRAVFTSPVATLFVAILLGVTLLGANATESASDEESRTEKLAKETQNAVANLISVPFQNNFNFGIGPNDATQWVLNVQPVIPDHIEQGLKPYHTNHHAHHQPTVPCPRNPERIWTG